MPRPEHVRQSPREIARELGLPMPGGQLSEDALVDLAVAAYWRNRPQPSRAAFVEHRRRQQRQTTPVEVWLRRGAA